MLKFLLLAAVSLVPAMGVMDFRTCPNGAPTPKSLHVSSCTADSPCIVPDWYITILGMGIVSPIDSATATAHVTIRVAGWTTIYELPPAQTDACSKGILGGCPLVTGKEFMYSLTIQNLRDAPGTDVPVEFEVGLTGDGGVALMCFRFEAYVKK